MTLPAFMEQLREAERERDELRLRLSKIRPLTDAERAVIYAEHDVVDEARRLNKAVGVINSTNRLDRAIKRLDEALAAREAGT